jgi:hypothetical protein
MNGGTVPGGMNARARRHERARPVHIADRFRHRLTHVGPLVKDQLEEGGALNAFARYVIDARDVEEVILVVISQVPFHLRRVHPAIRLRDVDGRIADSGKDVGGHPLQRQQGAKRDRDQRHHYRDRPAERR